MRNIDNLQIRCRVSLIREVGSKSRVSSIGVLLYSFRRYIEDSCLLDRS